MKIAAIVPVLIFSQAVSAQCTLNGYDVDVDYIGGSGCSYVQTSITSPPGITYEYDLLITPSSGVSHINVRIPGYEFPRQLEFDLASVPGYVTVTIERLGGGAAPIL